MKEMSLINPIQENVLFSGRKGIKILILLGLFWGCMPNEDQESSSSEALKSSQDTIIMETLDSTDLKEYSFPYKLKSPTAKFKLPRELEEISALSYAGQDTLAMVQDEKGRIYTFDLKNEGVNGVYKFGGSGDYEGLELVGKTAYVMESSGIIYEVSNYNRPNPKVRKFKTPLTSRNDAEGLGYLPEENKLLIACKESSGIKGKTYRRKRGIYSFDLSTNRFEDKPFILVDLEKLQNLLFASASSKGEREDAEDFDPRDRSPFQPSGIAIHPIDGHYYIIASAGKMLVVLNKKKKVVYACFLDRDILKQPEGICFSPEGDLFISNEGRSGKGNIIHFSYSQNNE